MFWTVTLPKCFLKSEDLLDNSRGSGLVSQRSSEFPSVTINVKDIDKSTLVFSPFFSKQASMYLWVVGCKSCFYTQPSCEVLPLNADRTGLLEFTKVCFEHMESMFVLHRWKKRTNIICSFLFAKFDAPWR